MTADVLTGGDHAYPSRTIGAKCFKGAGPCGPPPPPPAACEGSGSSPSRSKPSTQFLVPISWDVLGHRHLTQDVRQPCETKPGHSLHLWKEDLVSVTPSP